MGSVRRFAVVLLACCTALVVPAVASAQPASGIAFRTAIFIDVHDDGLVVSLQLEVNGPADVRQQLIDEVLDEAVLRTAAEEDLRRLGLDTSGLSVTPLREYDDGSVNRSVRYPPLRADQVTELLAGDPENRLFRELLVRANPDGYAISGVMAPLDEAIDGNDQLDATVRFFVATRDGSFSSHDGLQSQIADDTVSWEASATDVTTFSATVTGVREPPPADGDAGGGTGGSAEDASSAATAAGGASSADGGAARPPATATSSSSGFPLWIVLALGVLVLVLVGVILVLALRRKPQAQPYAHPQQPAHHYGSPHHQQPYAHPHQPHAPAGPSPQPYAQTGAPPSNGHGVWPAQQPPQPQAPTGWPQ